MGDDFVHASLPADPHKDLVCCRKCRLVKTAQQVWKTTRRCEIDR